MYVDCLIEKASVCSKSARDCLVMVGGVAFSAGDDTRVLFILMMRSLLETIFPVRCLAIGRSVSQ